MSTQQEVLEKIQQDVDWLRKYIVETKGMPFTKKQAFNKIKDIKESLKSLEVKDKEIPATKFDWAKFLED